MWISLDVLECEVVSEALVKLALRRGIASPERVERILSLSRRTADELEFRNSVRAVREEVEKLKNSKK